MEDAFKMIKKEFPGESFSFMNQCGEILNGT